MFRGRGARHLRVCYSPGLKMTHVRDRCQFPDQDWFRPRSSERLLWKWPVLPHCQHSLCVVDKPAAGLWTKHLAFSPSSPTCAGGPPLLLFRLLQSSLRHELQWLPWGPLCYRSHEALLSHGEPEGGHRPLLADLLLSLAVRNHGCTSL